MTELVRPERGLDLERVKARWLGTFSEHTARGYTHDLHAWLDWCEAAGVDPARPGPRDMVEHLAAMKADRKSLATQARRCSAVLSFYAYARDEGTTTATTALHRRTQTMTADHTVLRRKRWGAWAVLVLGLAVSVAANVLQAQPTPAGRAIAAWPPLALLLALELMTRVLVGRGVLTAALWVVTGGIGVIAAWVSYWHMRETVLQYGEQGISAWVLPLTVDGLVIVASGCLVVLTRALRVREHSLEQEHTGEHRAAAAHVTEHPLAELVPSPVAALTRTGRPDGELLAELEHMLRGGPVTVRRAVDELKVGTARARKLLAEADRRRRELAGAS